MKKMRKHMSIFLAVMLLSIPVISYGVEDGRQVLFENIFDSNMLTNSIKKEIDTDMLINKDLSIKRKEDKPQILIIHSHSNEAYKDKGSVIDVGEELKKELESIYQVSVLHDKGVYDIMNGVHTPVGAYERMEKSVKDILKSNPTIEVIIDIHRDGGTESTASIIEGVSTAQINIINGLSVDKKIGKMGSLKGYPNSYIQDNLAFSIQMKCKSDALSLGLISKIKTNEFRYSLHMLPKSLLVDIGNNEDSLKEAMNAVKPFANSLGEVLRLEKTK